MIEAGLHAGIPWQNEEMKPGYTQKVAQLLGLRCWHTWLADAPLPSYWHLTDAILDAESGGSVFASLWNEPERKDQANTDPEEAARLTKKWVRKHGTDFVGPNVLIAGDWKEWLHKYFAADGPMPSMWGVHIYAWTPAHFQSLFDEFKEFVNYDGRPVILTETACWSEHVADQKRIMDRVYASVSIGEIYAAFWFSAHYGSYSSEWARCDLCDGMGDLTELGRYFVDIEKKDYSVFLPVVAV